jgi:hypothetical protein
MKYNLFFHEVLGLATFPVSEIMGDENKFYDTQRNAYGVPLDNGANFTKADWSFWVGALGSSEQFDYYVDALWRFADESPSRIPLSDWYDTITGEAVRFQARPVMGGLYAKMLLV